MEAVPGFDEAPDLLPRNVERQSFRPGDRNDAAHWSGSIDRMLEEAAEALRKAWI